MKKEYFRLTRDTENIYTFTIRSTSTCTPLQTFLDALEISTNDIFEALKNKNKFIGIKYYDSEDFEYRYVNTYSEKLEINDNHITEFLTRKIDFEEIFKDSLNFYNQKYKNIKTISSFAKNFFYFKDNLIELNRDREGDNKVQEIKYEIKGVLNEKILLLKKGGKQFLREFYIYDKEIIQELKELELGVDENILRITEDIAGSASSCLNDVFILMSKYGKNKLILVKEEQGYEKYKVNEDFIEVKSYECTIDDYTVEIFINGIPIIEFDPDFEFKDKFHKELYRNRLPSGDVRCVPFIFRKERPLSDYAIDIPFETVRELDIHSVIDKFIILSKSIRYDEDMGLII